MSHRKSELSRTVLEAGGTANEQDGQSGVGDAELRSDDIRS